MESATCRKCGRKSPAEMAPGSLCPGCLLELGREAEPGASAPSTTVPAAPLPRHIGAYRIVRLLGVGGMGVVYEAEQQEPRRPVALKVIRGGRYVDENLVRMFRREAQTLARLRHPGIASIYESGRTEDGQHFFAMELVRGRTLDAYLAASPPPPGRSDAWLRDRLALFRKVCDAVSYAHQRGVIHRDLKPANILVLHPEPAREGSGSGPVTPDVKILDFGLARITETDLAVSTILTDVGKVHGTLPYMSPEQVRGNPDELDLRTDVYSLGVVLYEMLTGGLPYEVTGLGLAEAMRVIGEQPPRPASRACPGRLDRDVETILAKALAKEPSRRYQSVVGLSEDLGRYLADQPILARPASVGYQLRKMVSRHRIGFAFAVTVLLLLVGFAVGMGLLAGRIAREAERANREAEAATRVSSFLEELFERADPGRTRGNTITAREVLDKGAEQVRRGLEEQPLLQARLMGTMGRVYHSLGLYEEAEPLLREALAVREERLGERHPDVATSLHDLARVVYRAGDLTGGAALERRALEIRREVLGAESLPVAESLQWLGTLAMERGEVEKAEPLLTRSLEIREALLPADHVDVGWGRYYLGAYLAYFKGEPTQAKPLLEDALRIFRAELGPEHVAVAWCLNDLSQVEEVQGNLVEAISLSRSALKLKEKLLGPEHPDVASGLNGLGVKLTKVGEYVEAQQVLERSLRLYEATLGSHYLTGRCLDSLGRLLYLTRDFEEALVTLERARAMLGEAVAPDSPELGSTLGSLAAVLHGLGRLEEAERRYREAFAILGRHAHPAGVPLAEVQAGLARLLRETGRVEEAERVEARMAVSRAEEESP